MLRNVVIAVLVLAVVAGALVWYAKHTAGPPPSPAPSGVPVAPPPKASRLSAAGGDIVQKDQSGKVLWRLKIAGSISGSEETGAVQARDITFETAAAQAGKAWTATAPGAYVDYGNRRITFAKGVKVHAQDGSLSFAADRVEYQMDTRKIVGDGDVRMTFLSGKVAAGRIVVDSANGEVRAHAVRGAYGF
jgi:LPS export ABC transporter protein LptC